MNYFQALANFDAQQRALQAEIEDLRAENEELRCRVQELEDELGETRLQLGERMVRYVGVDEMGIYEVTHLPSRGGA